MRDGMSGTAIDAEAEFRKAVRHIFGSRCRAAWLSGSYVYKGARPGCSDIDVVIVLDEAQPVPADRGALKRIRAFVDAYLEVHARLGLDPDLDFPAEYVVPATLHEAIGWRGLAAEDSVAQSFGPVEGEDYWIGRPDRWFHAWISMTAFSRFLTGDESFHRAVKMEAWKCILRFLLLRSAGAACSREDFWPGLAQFGAKPSYHAFWPIEGGNIDLALADLEAEGSLAIVNGAIRAKMNVLQAWEGRLNARIAGAKAQGPLVLPPELHREIGAYAARRWNEMNPLARAANPSIAPV